MAPSDAPRSKQEQPPDLRALHETLMQRILEEEEELIAAHRTQIESNMALVRDEMNLLGEVRRMWPCVARVYSRWQHQESMSMITFGIVKLKIGLHDSACCIWLNANRHRIGQSNCTIVIIVIICRPASGSSDDVTFAAWWCIYLSPKQR